MEEGGIASALPHEDRHGCIYKIFASTPDSAAPSLMAVK